MFLHLSVILFTWGGMCGSGVCMAGGMHVGACMGSMCDRGVCMAGGHAWQGGMHGRGACMAGGHVW